MDFAETTLFCPQVKNKLLSNFKLWISPIWYYLYILHFLSSLVSRWDKVDITSSLSVIYHPALSRVFMIGASSPFTATVVLHYGSACILHFMKPHLFFKMFIPTASLKFTLKRGPNEKLHQRISWIYFADDAGVKIQDLMKLSLLLSTAVGAT